jgi:hypothetical protein
MLMAEVTWSARLLFAYPDPAETPDRDVFPHARSRFVDELSDRHRFVLDPLLIQQNVLLVESLQLAGNYLFDDLLGFARIFRLLSVYRRLIVDDVLRDFVARLPRRIRKRD